MKILIIEDEQLSAAKLQRLIATHSPQHEVVGVCDSIRGSVRWLNENECDLIFLDVQLSDGLCFEIFRQITPEAEIVITTAYDQYAIAAFKIGSFDYLLKPIEDSEFISTMQRIEPIVEAKQASVSSNSAKLGALSSGVHTYKKRFTVKLGDKIIVIDTSNIAYFLSEDKLTVIVTCAGRRYVSDLPLDAIEAQVNPRTFFRITRGCIANVESIRSVSKYLGSRLKVQLSPEIVDLEEQEAALVVSRKRVPEFLQWLEGEE